MNTFFNPEKFGIYGETELRTRLGLTQKEFKKLLSLEVEAYATQIKRQSLDYYKSRLKLKPEIEKYGGIPLFPAYPFKDRRCIFNDISGVYLEKKWSRANKYNEGKDLPFSFIFDNSK